MLATLVLALATGSAFEAESSLLSLEPYPYLSAMDGTAVPTYQIGRPDDTNVTKTLKSTDFNTWIETSNEQTSLYPSVAHKIVYTALNSCSHLAYSYGYRNGVCTLTHEIHTVDLGDEVPYWDYVDDYQGVDENTVLVLKDAPCNFQQLVQVTNQAPGGPGG